VFPTSTDQLLVGIVFPIEKLGQWRGKHRELYLQCVRDWAFTKPLTEGDPISKVLGFAKMRFFFREAAGKGWALVGDAGLFKDPAPGLGISDAFRDARALADAIVEGTDEALVSYWRERDVASLELFEFARGMGTPGYNNALNRAVFAKLRDRADLRERIVAVHDRRLSPFAAFSTGEIARWTVGELLRGRFDVVKPFLSAGKNGAEVAKELERWKALAREAREAREARDARDARDAAARARTRAAGETSGDSSEAAA
jgi:menaquinone-9 beta-reductase